jgi:hypothetical protein
MPSTNPMTVLRNMTVPHVNGKTAIISLCHTLRYSTSIRFLTVSLPRRIIQVYWWWSHISHDIRRRLRLVLFSRLEVAMPTVPLFLLLEGFIPKTIVNDPWWYNRNLP